MGRVADSFSDGKTVRVPPALVQPIFSNDVVTALADLVLGAPGNDTLEVAGPEKLRFDELIRRVLANNHDARTVTSDVHARYFGTDLNDQSLVPASTAPRIGTTRFESWLARSTSQTQFTQPAADERHGDTKVTSHECNQEKTSPRRGERRRSLRRRVLVRCTRRRRGR